MFTTSWYPKKYLSNRKSTKKYLRVWAILLQTGIVIRCGFLYSPRTVVHHIGIYIYDMRQNDQNHQYCVIPIHNEPIGRLRALTKLRAYAWRHYVQNRKSARIRVTLIDQNSGRTRDTELTKTARIRVTLSWPKQRAYAWHWVDQNSARTRDNSLRLRA